jgi:hypothetical protein
MSLKDLKYKANVMSYLKGMDKIAQDLNMMDATHHYRASHWAVANHLRLTWEEKSTFFKTTDIEVELMGAPDPKALDLLALADARPSKPIKYKGKTFQEVGLDEVIDLRDGMKFVAVPKLQPPEPPEIDAKFILARQAARDEAERWCVLPLVLQANECSRLHRLIEDIDAVTGPSKDWSAIQTFVVKHDWAAAFPDLGEITNNEVILPFPMCAFEFRISGKNVVVIATDAGVVADGAKGLHWNYFIEALPNSWWGFNDNEAKFLQEFCQKQVKAISAMLDAQVAEHQVIRQPTALQEKRKKTGKLPLYDFRVIDLSHRHRSARNPDANKTDRRHRCHWRRGHWRHFANHRTWIKWMLVGDPDLGFVEKEYKL